MAGYVSEMWIDVIIAYLNWHRKDISRPSAASLKLEVLFSNFISSLPEIRVRLLWALFLKFVAVIICRIRIFDLQRGFSPPYSPQLSHWLSDVLLGTIYGIIDVKFALEFSVLDGYLPLDSVALWAFFFTTTAAMPMLSPPKGLNRSRALFFVTSFVVLVPISTKIPHVTANFLLASTSLVSVFCTTPSEQLMESGKQIMERGSCRIVLTYSD
jgi:hypothetical protein